MSEDYPIERLTGFVGNVVELLIGIEQTLGSAHEVIAIHYPGDPGQLTVGVRNPKMNYVDDDLDMQAVLRRQGENATYDADLTTYRQLDLNEPPQDGVQAISTGDGRIYDTIDLTYVTPVMLPDGVGGSLRHRDGIEYLLRKMHHQLNGKEVDPRGWPDVVHNLRRGELNTSGMPESVSVPGSSGD